MDAQRVSLEEIRVRFYTFEVDLFAEGNHFFIHGSAFLSSYDDTIEPACVSLCSENGWPTGYSLKFRIKKRFFLLHINNIWANLHPRIVI